MVHKEIKITFHQLPLIFSRFSRGKFRRRKMVAIFGGHKINMQS